MVAIWQETYFSYRRDDKNQTREEVAGFVDFQVLQVELVVGPGTYLAQPVAPKDSQTNK